MPDRVHGSVDVGHYQHVRVALYRNHILACDPSTFEVLGGGYVRDAERAFYERQPLRDCDVARLRWLGGPYACDGIRVYLRGARIDADGATFEVLGTIAHRTVGRDREVVWVDDHASRDLHAGSFELLGAYLVADRAGVRCWFEDSMFLDADAVDRASLRIVDEDHAIDRARCYYRGRALDSLEGGMGTAFAVLGAGYATDGATVFWRTDHIGTFGNRVPLAAITVLDDYHAIVRGRAYVEGGAFGCDPAVLPVISLHGWGEDEGAPPACDPATLRGLGYRFSADAHRVYFRGRVVEGASPGTFSIVRNGWARDRGRMWWFESSKAATEAFEMPVGELELLDDTTARDAEHVYRGNRVLAGADPDTFRVRGDGWYSDGTSVWYEDSRVAGARPDSLVVRGGEHAVVEVSDQRDFRAVGDGVIAGPIGVAVRGHIVDGPSPDSVRSLGGGYLVDATAAYFFERVFDEADNRHVVRGGRIPDVDPANVRRDRAFLFAGERVYRGTTCVSDRAAAFRVLDSHHGTDGVHAFHDAQRIACDPARLRVLGGTFVEHQYKKIAREFVDDAWATDDTTLFLRGLSAAERPMPDDDRAAFARLDLARLRAVDRWYATDGRCILDLRHAVVGIHGDAATFEALGAGWAVDRGTLYYPNNGRGTREYSPGFAHVGFGYATEDDGASYFGNIIEDYDPPLVALGGTWARDASGILCAGVRVPADPDTFVVLGRWDATEATLDPASLGELDHPVARDADRLWFSCRGWSDVPASGVLLGHGYVMTPDRVFWQSTPLDVDLATFVVVGEGYACDARAVYYLGEQLA